MRDFTVVEIIKNALKIICLDGKKNVFPFISIVI